MKTLCFFTSLILFYSLCLNSCGQPEEKIIDTTINSEKIDSAENRFCTEYELSVFDASDTGNFKIVRDYLLKEGDPMLRCYDPRSSSLSPPMHLYVDIMLSDSIAMIKHFLTHDISDEIKDRMFVHFVSDDNQELITYMIEQLDCHYKFEYLCLDKVATFETLIKNNYDINWQNPDYKNRTLLMDIAGCPAPDGAASQIELMIFLINNGARTDLIDSEGKTLIDIAVNSEIKEFIEGL